MSGVIVNYNNNALTSMSSSGTKTLLTSGKYCEGNFEVVYSEPTTSSLTVTPTETAQTFNATGVYGYKPVTVNGISSTYVGTNISRRGVDDINWDLDNGYIGVPSGYYSDGVPLYINTVSHPKPTIGISSTTGVVTATHQMSVGRYIPTTYSSIVTSTYSLPTQAAQTFYPSTADQTISSYRWLTGAQTIKSVTTSNLTAANIAEGVTVAVGDATNASRITQVTGTHKGGGGHDAVLLNAGVYNETMPLYKYVRYNGTRYYTNEDTFNFNEEDTIETLIYGYSNGSNVYLNNTLIGSGMTVSFSAPSYPLTVYFSADGIYFNKAYPSGTLSITSNGTYNVYGYSSASVNVQPTYTATITQSTSKRTYVKYNNTTYRSGSFTYHPGEICYMYASGEMAGGPVYEDGVLLSRLDYGVSYAYILPSYNIGLSLSTNGTGEIDITSTPTLDITSNGTYNVYGYVSASVSVAGGDYYKIYSAIVNEKLLCASGSTSHNYTSDDIIDWCDSLSKANTFTGVHFSGNFSFNNVTEITRYAFAFPQVANLGQITAYYHTFNFPIISSISAAAFAYRTTLSEFSAASCSIIASYAFYSCYGLVNISFPNCTTIGSNAFVTCQSLTTASFSNCTSIGNCAFSSCVKLITANFPKCTNIGYAAFSYCLSLSSVSFPNCTSVGGYAFGSCSTLTTISLPNCTSVGDYAFAYCSALTTISLPKCTSLATFTFYSCPSLLSVSFPSCTTIGAYAFGNCTSLTTASFPNCTSVGGYAFSKCSALTTISLPKCASFGMYVFSSCYNLISLYLDQVSAVPTFSTGMFNSTPISTYSTVAGRYGSIFVPSSLYSAFTTATSWSAYSARMVSV